MSKFICNAAQCCCHKEGNLDRGIHLANERIIELESDKARLLETFEAELQEARKDVLPPKPKTFTPTIPIPIDVITSSGSWLCVRLSNEADRDAALNEIRRAMK